MNYSMNFVQNYKLITQIQLQPARALHPFSCLYSLRLGDGHSNISRRDEISDAEIQPPR